MRAAFVFGLAACARSAHPLPMSVIVDGDPGAVGALAHVDGLELHPIALPAPAPSPTNDSEARVARARSAYVGGDFATCRDELARIDLEARLAAGDRGLASRELALTAACAFGAAANTEARAAAERLASYGLDLPSAAVAPDVETMISKAIEQAGKEPTQEVAVTGEIGARLSVDGRSGTCTLPCTISLGPGQHVLAVDADGFQPATRAIRAPDEARVAIAQQPASPSLAADQWRARLGRGQPAADPIGVALLAKIGRDPRVAYLHGAEVLSGSLVVDGKLAATATAKAGDNAGLLRNLAYDGRVLSRPPIWQRPWFLIAVASAALVATGAVLYLNRPTDTSVHP